MKNKTLKISVSLIIILLSFIQITSAEESMMFPVCTNGCHTERGISFGVSGAEWCGSCHLYVSKGKIDIATMEGSHNKNICKLCHTVQDTNEYHTLHANVTAAVEGANYCNRCHGETGQGLPLSKFNDCAGCHSGKVHDIHEDNIDLICLNCHGVAPSKPSQTSIESPTEQIYATVVDYKKYTILELIKSLFGWN